ncbi:hypothetical protein [Tenacibaculum sp.]|uniref:hypothetical protein n=1 Tax=Tenacibaculum sp. TaxID=1906242 RepID=UPI003D126AD6
MALALKLLRTGINSVGSEMYLQDSTGDYILETNEGGWGVPNPERNSKALLVEAFLNKTAGPVSVEVKEYDPETVDNFTLLTKEDGYYEVFMVAVDKQVPTVEGEYGWDALQGLLKFEGGSVKSVTPKTLYDDPTFADAVSFKTVLLANIAIYRNTKNLELIKLRMQKYNDRAHNREIEDLENHFFFVRSLLDGANYMWCADNYTEAQRIVESFNEVAYD